MAAQVLPFPAYRRKRFVAKQATRMSCLSCDAAQNHLQHQLRVQADAMARKGISPELITEQQRRLERAIRAELWRLVQCPGDQV
jgi:hypothetical protein